MRINWPGHPRYQKNTKKKSENIHFISVFWVVKSPTHNWMGPDKPRRALVDRNWPDPPIAIGLANHGYKLTMVKLNVVAEIQS